MDTKQIQQVLRERGWCQVYAEGYFYNTVGGASPEGIDREAEQGWQLVGIFARDKDMVLVTEPSVKPNLTVFRRAAPAFFTADNPWADKGPLLWLPDLTRGPESALAHALCKAGGHGSPGMARRFRCACGEQVVICYYDDENGRAEVECSACKRRTLVSDVQEQESELRPYVCDCGTSRVWLDLGIEYPVDAEGGWEFSWITVAATCCSCSEAAILFSDEFA